MKSTEEYIERLKLLKEGELGLLRTHAFQGLDESLQAFDLFTGIYWPLREKNQYAPRREVAWLIAKLYAFRPLKHETGALLALQLKRLQPHEDDKRNRFREKFDELITTDLARIETPLRWALDAIAGAERFEPALDWVKLTDDLSWWEKQQARLQWTKQLVNKNLQYNLKEKQPC